MASEHLTHYSKLCTVPLTSHQFHSRLHTSVDEVGDGLDHAVLDLIIHRGHQAKVQNRQAAVGGADEVAGVRVCGRRTDAALVYSCIAKPAASQPSANPSSPYPPPLALEPYPPRPSHTHPAPPPPPLSAPTPLAHPLPSPPSPHRTPRPPSPSPNNPSPPPLTSVEEPRVE